MDISLNYKNLKQWNYLIAQKKLIGKTKNGENLLSLEVVERMLVQCNLEDNQWEEKSEVLHIFTPNNT